MIGLASATMSPLDRFPIGAIYINLTNSNPSIIFGGQWEQIKDRFLVCSGTTYTNNSTGGINSHTHSTANHALSIDQMPSHNHQIVRRQQWYMADTVHTAESGNIFSWKSGTGTGGSTSSSYRSSSGREVALTGGSIVHNHGNTGSASVLPPYIVVTVWKRVG